MQCVTVHMSGCVDIPVFLCLRWVVLGENLICFTYIICKQDDVFLNLSPGLSPTLFHISLSLSFLFPLTFHSYFFLYKLKIYFSPFICTFHFFCLSSHFYIIFLLFYFSQFFSPLKWSGIDWV